MTDQAQTETPQETSALAIPAGTPTLATRKTPSLATQRISTGEIENFRLQAAGIAADELAKGNAATIEQAQAVALRKMLMANELGLPAMTTATRHMHDIKGTLTLSASIQRALAINSGIVHFEWREVSEERVTLYGRRLDRPPDAPIEYEVTWTPARAKAEGIWKDNWGKMFIRMARARCTTELTDLICPDLTGGLYAPEDIGFIEDDNGAIEPLDGGPLGEEWAREFTRTLNSAPNTIATGEALAALKIEHWQSADYKIRAISRTDQHILEAFRDERLAGGPRIGTVRAEALLKPCPGIAVKTGMEEATVVARVDEMRERFGAEALADLTSAQELEVTRMFKGLVPDDDDTLEGDFEAAPEGDVDFEGASDTPPGTIGKLAL